MKSNDDLYLYPLWLRLWHWLNALLFLLLISTGINLQYSNPDSPMLLDFKTSIIIHNISGITLTLNYVVFFISNIISGNWRQYFPALKGLFGRLTRQLKYYLNDIFKSKPHPFETTKNSKFNPLQQLTYLKIMYLLMPLLIFTGWGMLFPDSIVDRVFGINGLLLVDILHVSIGFILSIFMIAHIYLGTTGKTVRSSFKSMITGYHESH